MNVFKLLDLVDENPSNIKEVYLYTVKIDRIGKTFALDKQISVMEVADAASMLLRSIKISPFAGEVFLPTDADCARLGVPTDAYLHFCLATGEQSEP